MAKVFIEGRIVIIGYLDSNPKSIDSEENVLIITKKTLDDKKAKGCKLARDFSCTLKRYIWEDKEKNIKNKLISGVSRQKNTGKVGIFCSFLCVFLKLNPKLKMIRGGAAND